MGFSSLIDIIGSFIIGGILFMMLLRMNDAAVANAYKNGGQLIVQQNLVEIVELLEHDFRKIGFCEDWSKIPNPSASILSADSNSISFITDSEADGEIDTLKYFLGSADELYMTPNPNDKFLYRVENSNEPIGANLGLTEFNIKYYDTLGDELTFPITDPGEIHTLQIDLKVENTSGYDGEYTSAFWRQIRLAARNLRNR
jgi:hypothetical protein